MSSYALAKIIGEVKAERERQDRIHGENSLAAVESPLAALPILIEEVGEVSKAVHEMRLASYDFETYYKWRSNYREELIQVAACAIAMVEVNDTLNHR